MYILINNIIKGCKLISLYNIMKSIGYSTFYNDIDTVIDIDNDKQCLICLQGPLQSSNNIIIDDVKLINEMHFLVKACKCECYSHHKCIEKWIENNSVCPICKGPISFPKSGIKEEIIQIPNTEMIQAYEISQAPEMIQAHEIIILHRDKSNNHLCVRFIIILFFIFLIFTVLNIN